MQISDSQIESCRLKLSYLFNARRAGDHVEDLVNETIMRVLGKHREGQQFRNLESYCVGVAKFVWLEHLRRRELAGEEELANARASEPDPVREYRQACLDECLMKLSHGDRSLLHSLFWDALKAAEVGGALNITANAVHGRLHKIIHKKLNRCVKECVLKKEKG